MIYLILSIFLIKKKLFSFNIFLLNIIINFIQLININQYNIVINNITIYSLISLSIPYIVNIIDYKNNVLNSLYHKYLYKVGIIIYIYLMILSSYKTINSTSISLSVISLITIILLLIYIFINKNQNESMYKYFVSTSLIFLNIIFISNYNLYCNIIILIMYLIYNKKNIIDYILKFNIVIISSLAIINFILLNKNIYYYLIDTNYQKLNISLYLITSYLLFVALKINKLISIIISILILLAFILYI